MAIVATATAEAQTTLSDFLQRKGWDAAKSGPLLVLEPQAVKATGIGLELADYQRALTRLGSISVIAPTEMVLIDDSFSDPANLYDGLDRNKKILYLLTLLSQQQWSQITGTGLCMNDLRGEPRAVLQSLLPKPLKWTAWEVGAKLTDSQKHDSGTVSDDQMDEVKIKLDCGLNFAMNLVQQPNSITFASSLSKRGYPGEALYYRDIGDFDGSVNPYGVKQRQVVPNQPKPSQLSYGSHALDAPVSLRPSMSISEALQSAQEATGIELHADLRVADRKLESRGNSCRAGDLLKAIALTVTGTFRKVGPAFVLTSDLEGIGTRKLKFALWERSVDKEANRRSDEWKHAIQKSGHVSEIHFPTDSPFAPNEAMQTLFSQNSFDMAPTSGMTSGVRAFLDEFNLNHPTQQIDTSKVRISTNVQYSFVLPTGQTLHPDSLGSLAEYPTPPARAVRNLEIPNPPYSLAGTTSPQVARPAIVNLDDPRFAIWLIDLLHKYGFKEIWISSKSAEAVRVAAERCKALQLKAKLLVRPWDLSEPWRADEEDATLLGDRGDQLAMREKTLDLWGTLTQDLAPPTPSRAISPGAKSNFSRWANLAALARTPGVTGLVIEDLQPHGYEGNRTDAMHSDVEKPLGEMSDFGYSISQRLEFLRSHGLDPIDTEGEYLMVMFDLRQPFFPDNATKYEVDIEQSDAKLAAATQAWDKALADMYTHARDTLLASLPNDLPDGILVPPNRELLNQMERTFPAFQRWPSGGHDVSQVGKIYRFPANGKEEPGLPERMKLGFSLGLNFGVGIDFRDLRVEALPSVLDRFFVQVVPIRIQPIGG
jgi:hypothetical protein